MATLASIDLFYTARGSDKEYHLQLQQSVNFDENRVEYEVPFQYGRRGSTLNGGYKYRGDDETKAHRVFKSFIREKVAKGYTVHESGEPGTTTIEEAIAIAYGNRELAVANGAPDNSTIEPSTLVQEPVQTRQKSSHELTEIITTRRILWSGRTQGRSPSSQTLGQGMTLTQMNV